MRCPNCYGKVDKTANICAKCGFNVNKLKNASNKKAKEMIRQGDADLCVNSKILPNDVSKKKLLLFSAFLGWFGAHYFYVGKMLKGFLTFLFGFFGLLFCVIDVTIVGKFPYWLQVVEFIFGFGFVFVIINTIFDFINILRNKFSVPVYVEEDEKKKK